MYRFGLLVALGFAIAAPCAAQSGSADATYALEALKVEATDVGEKTACFWKVYATRNDALIESFQTTLTRDREAFSDRVESYITKFGRLQPAQSIPTFRLNTWTNVSWLIEKKRLEISDAPDGAVMGRCNMLASSARPQVGS